MLLAQVRFEIPWVHLKFGSLRVVIIEVVFTTGDVVVMDAFDDGPVTEILFDIEVVFPPLGAWCSVSIGTDEAADITAVIHLGRALVVGAAAVSFNFV